MYGRCCRSRWHIRPRSCPCWAYTRTLHSHRMMRKVQAALGITFVDIDADSRLITWEIEEHKVRRQTECEAFERHGWLGSWQHAGSGIAGSFQAARGQGPCGPPQACGLGCCRKLPKCAECLSRFSGAFHSTPNEQLLAMGKKRKVAVHAGGKGDNLKTEPENPRKRIRTFEDVADSDDEFHMNRDNILLEEAPDTKRRREWQEREEFLQPSDEEVLGGSEPDEEDEHEEIDGAGQVREEDLLDSEDAEDSAEEGDAEGWGTTKADLYGADVIETEEQALEEEAEALRLQKKQLQGMSAADYGFDEEDWQDTAALDKAQTGRSVVTEVLPQQQISDDLSPVERLNILKARYPEFEPLSRELLDLREVHSGLAAEVVQFTESGPKPNATTRYRAASAYLGALTMYFALLTSPVSQDGRNINALPANALRDHRLMESLVECRAVWQTAQDLPVDRVRPRHDAAAVDRPSQARMVNASKDTDAADVTKRSRSSKKSRKQRHADAVKAAEDARRTERMKRTEADLADLDALLALSAPRQALKIQPAARGDAQQDGSDIGEEAPLTGAEAEEKAKRKKSLRFYTSQIAQKVNKRGAAGRNAGGDDDIPHRERLKDRQARLNAKAEKRGHQRAEAGDDLGGASEEEDVEQAQRIRADAADDDYYDMVAARTARKKGDKAALAEAQRLASEQGGRVVEEEGVGADGKRKITYAIEKNKGLTPHRRKDVRNPRVKKRKRFEAKSKKLASMKPVYKGGEGRGGYGGELTGIKTNVVKSTKL